MERPIVHSEYLAFGGLKEVAPCIIDGLVSITGSSGSDLFRNRYLVKLATVTLVSYSRSDILINN